MRYVSIVIVVASCSHGTPSAIDAEVAPVDAIVVDEPGFTAQYFTAYRELAATRTELAIDHSWGTGAPADGVGADHFSARFTGTLELATAGTYAFAVAADDGVRLWIGEQLIVDDWRPHLVEHHAASVELAAGRVPIRVEYFEADLGAELHVAWTPPGGTEAVLDGAHVRTAAPIAAAPKPPYANPVLDSNCPDPGILAVGAPVTYYALCTGGKFPIRRSHDLVMWEATGATVFPTGKPPWAANGNRNWAPELHEVAGQFLVYYTSVNAANRLSIGVAHAASPTGPFVDRGSALVEDPLGVIDATYVRAGATHYLAYKIDGNSAGKPTPIYLRELAADGTAFAPGSAPVEILRNDPATWEGGVVEAPWIVEHAGRFYLFYSGNVYDARYRTGVARATSITGPYVKLGTPILANTSTWVGPGHGSVVAANGKDYFVYHAWHADGAGGNDASRGRVILVDAIAWANGWPAIAGPSAGLDVWPGE